MKRQSFSAGQASVWKGIFERGSKAYYPSKPSDEEILIYKDLLKRYGRSRARVLILGVTPCLRDLCLDFGYEVVDDDRDIMIMGNFAYFSCIGDSDERIADSLKKKRDNIIRKFIKG